MEFFWKSHACTSGTKTNGQIATYRRAIDPWLWENDFPRRATPTGLSVGSQACPTRAGCRRSRRAAQARPQTRTPATTTTTTWTSDNDGHASRYRATFHILAPLTACSNANTCWLKKNWSCSLAMFMHSCSNELYLKFSKPKMSSMPITLCSPLNETATRSYY